VNPIAKAIASGLVVLVAATVLLLGLTAWALHGVRTGTDHAYGWDAAFNILTSRSSCFGTQAGWLAVALALCGFFLVPAVAGAVAGVLLGAYASHSQRVLDAFIESSIRQADAREAKEKAALAEKEKEKEKAALAEKAGGGNAGGPAAPGGGGN